MAGFQAAPRGLRQKRGRWKKKLGVCVCVCVCVCMLMFVCGELEKCQEWLLGSIDRGQAGAECLSEEKEGRGIGGGQSRKGKSR